MADSFWGDDEETKKQKAYEQGLQDDARADPDGFLNLQRYVGVNEGKGLEMAHSAADQVSSQAESLKSDVSKAKTEFDAAKNAATLDNPYAYAQGAYTPNENGGGFSSDQTTSGKGKGGLGEGSGSASSYSNIYEWDPELTADDAETKAQAEYTGPEGLESKDFNKRSTEVGGLANDVGSGEGLASRSKELYAKGAEGSYGAGKSAYDAMLAGATGGGELAAIQSKYGGLEKYVTDEQEAATAAAQAAAATTKQNAGYYGGIAGQLRGAGAASAALKAEQDKNDAAYGLAREGKESWDDYINNNRFENTLKTAANVTDPIAMGLHAAGQKSAEDAINPGADAYVNKNYGGTVNSNKIDWAHRMPGAHDDGRIMVYESLTTAELRKVENMSWADQERFLGERLQLVYKKKMIDEKNKAQSKDPNRGPLTNEAQIRRYMPWYTEGR